MSFYINTSKTKDKQQNQKTEMHIGFLFGAGAEFGYGLPSGYDFALSIFRNAKSSKTK